MNRETRKLILKADWGEALDPRTNPFHQFNKPELYWPVIVAKPCFYMEMVNGHYVVLLCWKDQNFEQREFITTIDPESFLKKMRPAQSFLFPFVVFIGKRSKFDRMYLETDFCWENCQNKPQFILAINNMGNKFLVGIVQTIENGKIFYPKKFDFEEQSINPEQIILDY